jgi:hypothetical protein
MNNVTLSKKQLYQLISFINKHGFKEPLVVVEILDHFACKVEEKLHAYPRLTLSEAMVGAHNDFGIAGFAPIATAFTANIKKKYKGIYRAELKKVLTNPLYLITALFAAFFVSKAYYWAEINNYKHILGFNDVGHLLYLASNVGMVGLLLHFKQSRKQRNPIVGVIMLRYTWITVPLICVCFHSGPTNTKQLMFLMITCGVGAFWYVVDLFTMYAALKKGCSDSKLVYDYINTIGQ